MSFSENTYKKAFEIKKDRRYKAQREYERIKNEVYSANPRLYEIEQALCGISAQAAVAAISGNIEKANTLRQKGESFSEEKKRILSGIKIPSVQYDCPICEDTGYVGGKICNCVKEIAKNIAFSELSSEMPIEECRFDNFDLAFYADKTDDGLLPKKRMTQVLKCCKEFSLKVGNTSESLLLLGKTGLGKTHLSLAIANEALHDGCSVIYGSAQNLINKAAAEQFSYKGDTSVIDGLLGCDLLIIDDLGAEMVTSFSKSCIYNIINTRQQKKLPTVISTNLSLEEIGNVYTPRVSSRIIGGYTLLQFLGTDIRQQKAISSIR